ncbi:protein kinase [Myxococcus landrumensis]|uniref:non-specific serine/threonine protein kinase n=2 Tax=Myxococcus landrumensis TaxID=2813577 RepID=A0ABX7NLD5_9BACT|nr:protein kinase [Myxococcus landrumus]
MQIGKYVVRRKLAEGGMAEIYLCTAQGAAGFEKEVVIKRVRSFLASDPEFVGMFIAEARLVSRLNHANVVQIFDFDQHEDTYYLAMEYVRGCSLWELRKRCKEMMDPVPPMLVAHIGAEVARGLHYAHRLKVDGHPLDLVHRDVTPQNVLLSHDGAVKLTDFGIAKAGKKLTQPGVLKGKFAYMSPEQARGEDVDSRTDLFALGIVLWELLTGGRLFDGESELAVLRAVQHSVIPPPARLNPEVPEALDAVVMRALERDPSARFQTAGEMERALAQCVLEHATSVDETDLGAFMRRLFPVSPTQALPAIQERTHVLGDAPAPEGQDSAPSPSRREPTAVLKPGRTQAREPASPDEDVDADTFVLPRRGEEVEGPARPVPMATPRMPLPAIPSSPVGRTSAAADATVQPEGASLEGSVRVPPRTQSRPGGVAVVSEPALVDEAERQAEPTKVGRTKSQSRRLGGSTSESSSGLAARDSVEAESSSLVPADDEEARADRSVPVATGSASSEGAAAGSVWSKPWVLALAVGLGVALVGGAFVVHRFDSGPKPLPASRLSAEGQPRATPPQANAEPAAGPRVAGGGNVQNTTVPAVGAKSPELVAASATAPAQDAADSEAEVEGLKRESVLATPPKSGEEGASQQPARQAAVNPTGLLVVKATPYATVFLDGRRLGEVSGRASYKLAPGTYKLLFNHPAGDKRFEVTITEGATVTREFRPPRSR